MKRAKSVLRSSSFEALLLFPALLLLVAAKPAATPAAESAESRALSTENAAYRKALDLATGEGFYYILDPEAPTLSLMYQGNLLEEYPLLEVEVGRRRGFLGSGAPPGNWSDRIWEEGELSPPLPDRGVELDTSDEDYEEQREATLVPPTPEEAYPAPEVWHIRYLGGLTLEIHGVSDSTRVRPGFLTGLGLWFSDGFEGLLPREKDSIRLRLYLPEAEAGALYRGVPPATRFTILRRPS